MKQQDDTLYPWVGAYVSGGPIHIKPENRGKFTAAANRAGKSVQSYASQILAHPENYSSTLVKRANFAKNAAKWHDDGGFLNPDDPEKKPTYLIKPVDLFAGMRTPDEVAGSRMSASDRTYVAPPAHIAVTNREIEAVEQRNEAAKRKYPYLTEQAAVAKAQEDYENIRKQAVARYGNNVVNGEKGLEMVSPVLKPLATLAGFGVAGSTGVGAIALPWLFAGMGAKNFYEAGRENANKDKGVLEGFADYATSPQGVFDMLFMAPAVGRVAKAAEPFAEATKDAALFNLANRGTGARMPYFWEKMPKVTSNITSGTSASSVPAMRFTAIGKPYFINTFELQHPANLAALNQGRNVLSLPQSTGIYPQIKPLMRGAEIERQLSKQGTISRKQLNAYIAKQKGYYKDLMNEVLDSEFKGLDKINYNSFKYAVQQRIPKTEITDISTGKYRDYGLDRLGYESTNYNTPQAQAELSKYNIKDLGNGNVEVYEKSTGRKLSETEVNELNNKIESFGDISEQKEIKIDNFMTTVEGLKMDYEGTNHFGSGNHGHTRSYINKEGDTRYVIEMQSDYFQTHDGGKPYWDVNSPLENHMAETTQGRMLQEVMKKSAMEGQTKVRFATPETAAKVEGFEKEITAPPSDSPEYANYNQARAEYDRIIRPAKAEYDRIEIPAWDEYNRIARQARAEYDRIIRQAWAEYDKITRPAKAEYDKIKKQAADEYDRIERQAKAEYDRIERQAWAEYNRFASEARDRYLSKYMSYDEKQKKVLTHYEKMPKSIKKNLGVEPKVVTDAKGNTWYEVNVPEYYRNKTAEIQFQNTTNLNGNTPWTQENAQEAADWATTFFTNDVVPRLLKNRPGFQGTRYTSNSPLLGTFALGETPSNARGMTSSIIQNKNGNQYVTTMNAKDLSSLEDKIGGVIHEMREDMINFHRGLYSKEDQEAYQYMLRLDKALKENDVKTINELAPQYREMEQRLGIDTRSPFLTEEETSIIESAYKTPNKPQLKSSGNLNEKVAENTRFRSEVSRRHGGVTGEELDRIIDNMSDDEVMEILESGDSYGVDYAQYIKENPQEKSQMIRNIKLAWKKVGVVAGVATGLEGIVIQGRNTKPE